MASTTDPSALVAAPPLKTRIPRLENGDRLSRPEFERRYQAMPDVKKAELVEGIVFMPSPVRLKKHAKPHLELVTWLGNYKNATPYTEAADNATTRLDLDNEHQPDVILRILPQAGGATRDSEDDYVEGPPELCAEVAASSASYDCHAKKGAFRRNGVQEYLIWIVEEERIEWWELVEGEYRAIPPDSDGFLKSRIFPGLWLDAGAMLALDGRRVDEVLRLGMATAEHGAFVQRLSENAAGEG